MREVTRSLVFATASENSLASRSYPSPFRPIRVMMRYVRSRNFEKKLSSSRRPRTRDELSGFEEYPQIRAMCNGPAGKIVKLGKQGSGDRAELH